ncbi:kinase-like protein [Viridothelium virens]|uniref:non-specific serine/threonine protein kinase n=1 Tax=Viridothelium virens TaxID=1048519 RepID=A0A6A6HG73_VIRVR|nr:kinase-like protein [Viridothelium virens]
MQESQVITQSAADTPQTEGGTPQTRGLSDNGGSGTPSVVAGNTGADETTSSDGLPKTPAGSSEVGFRAEIAIQTAEELANLDNAIVETAGEDEPSAVDYNPTADMQADKMRELERRGEDMSAQDYKESEADTKQMLVSQGSTKEPLSDHKPQQSVKDIDMFAEDDDMFASESDIQTKPGVTQAPKVLNANMLDDWDTPDGYYKVILGELLDNRYHVTAKLGSGVFSGVIRAWDTKVENKEVAIKIIRNNESMKKAAFTELNVLNRLREQDPQDRRHVVRLERSFNHKGHLCMVFESLDVDLRSALKIHGKQSGLSIEAIRHFGRQMFLALLLFKQTDILHADLKPDNILLRDASKIIKICDLGSAVDISDVYANEPRPYLASRFYRAPELILGMKYDFAIDMWSIGCTLFELFTCRILFSGRHNNAMLRSMMECRGRFPQKLLKRASEAHYANNGIVEFPFNDMLDQFYSREEEKLTGRELGKWIPVTRLAERGRDLKSRIFAVVDVKRLKPSEHKELELLHDLLDKCLQLNPDKRLTPDQALQHAFLKNHTISKR